MPRARRVQPLGLLTAALCAAAVGGCLGGHGPRSAQRDGRFYPPAPQTPHVVALGTLRGVAAPSETETQLSLILFGVEPPPPLTLLAPTGLAARAGELLICDQALDAVFVWRDQTLHDQPVAEPLDHPFAVAFTDDGERLICERADVVRLGADGAARCRYALPDEPFRPGGVAVVGDTVWVSNVAAHHVEVFDLATGAHRRSIGQRGSAPGEFAMPRGLARTPDGHVCVVDQFNARVQVFDADGNWVRSIGEPGDNVGSLGRPRDVAVGPDGTIFVSDAFAQQIKAFSATGAPLLAFGEPGSGPGELHLPAGVAIATNPPMTVDAADAARAPQYYVVVAEQLQSSGVRVYAWLGATADEATIPPAPPATAWKPAFPGSAAINPHWNADRCTTCHESAGGTLQPIAAGRADALCLSCHDGTKAPADPHPIGRHATTELVQTPPDWPTVDGNIGCLTCHDLTPHCSAAARRPAVNAALLRNFDPQRALEYCGTCHRADVGGRFSPHRQRDATGRIREDACLFCHTRRPQVPEDGRRQFQPFLRTASSDLCLNCHTKHWDLSPLGHVDRPVTPRIEEWMLVRELGRAREATPAELARLAKELGRPPARLPLGDGKVTCYTCHNPHYTGLFPADSELGALADNPADRHAGLRTNWIDLCSECHHH